MIVVSNPKDQIQFDEIVQEIKNISNKITKETMEENPRQWKLKMYFSTIRDLVWQGEALLKGDTSGANDF